ncbi:MAG: hypothetical protein WDM77_15440 [Steroidobacteraceae bacterium]
MDSIPLGQDFRGHLNGIIGGCIVVLAIIGPKWLDTRNNAGQRRLEDPDDFVRIELEAALSRDIPVVPVLVGHAPMLGAGDLPASLGSMIYRQSIEVRPDPDFHNDATRLVSALKVIIDPNAPRDPAPSQSGTQSPVARLLWPAAFAVAAVAAIAFAIPALKHLRESPLPETRTEISVHASYANGGQIALSPDGRQIVFVEADNGIARLWLRALAATTAQPLPGTEGANLPFWSPDSRSIGFFTESTLKRLDVGGGAPLALATVGFGQGGSWNTDGIILFSEPGKGLARIAATGGAVTQVTPLKTGAVLYSNPVFLPDGRRFAYLSIGGKTPGLYLGAPGWSCPRPADRCVGKLRPACRQVAADLGRLAACAGCAAARRGEGYLGGCSRDAGRGQRLRVRIGHRTGGLLEVCHRRWAGGSCNGAAGPVPTWVSSANQMERTMGRASHRMVAALPLCVETAENRTSGCWRASGPVA